MNPLQQIADNLAALNSDAPEVADAVIKLTNMAGGEPVAWVNGGFFDLGEHGDSPDGLIGDDGVIEIKSVIAPVHYATLRRGSFDPAYRWQLVSHLDCTGRQWVDFASFCSDFPEGQQLIVHRLTRSDCAEEIMRLRARRAEFLALIHEITNHIQQKEAA